MRILSLSSLLFMLLIGITSCNFGPSHPVTIEDAWIREAPPNATAMAGYMLITNHTENNIILQSATSPAFKTIEFHRSVEKDGVYRMIPQLHLHIDANSSFELKPGDFHLMLFNPVKRLVEGDNAVITLNFSDEQTVVTTVPVKKAQF